MKKELINLLKPNKVVISYSNNINQEVSLINNKAEYEDMSVSLLENRDGVEVHALAKTSMISHIFLTYDFEFEPSDLVYGDALERSYADLEFSHPDTKRMLFWYLFVKDEKEKNMNAIGVKVQSHSIVLFKLIDNKLVVDINTQCGGQGVNLEGRELNACTLVNRTYEYSYSSMKEFLKLLMGDITPLKPSHKIYGFNNWYYAYGNSSYEQIMKDTYLLKEVSKDNKNRPYMVIDDGWSINSCGGPWEANDKFIDMGKLAKDIASNDVYPGVWFRPLRDLSDDYKDKRNPIDNELLDPSCDEVILKIKEDVKKIINWGYTLIKYDYVTYDIFHKFAFDMDENLTEQGWTFKDNHYTNAELILRIYKAIRVAAKDAILIGCNTISHLCAGLVELNRIGDDTSGKEWKRTKDFGVNTLAFRLIQNNIFYVVDADCVGITNNIPWSQNKEWLELLAKSGSPLFVSCDPDVANETIKKDLTEAFKINAIQENECYPVDLNLNLTPSKWMIDGKLVSFNWNK